MPSVKPTLQQMSEALRSSWGSDTCYSADEWSTDNPARGQCVVSSLVVQDYLGGDLRRYHVQLSDGEETHYCNVLPDGTILDTTGSQYKVPVTLQVTPVDLQGYASVREKRLADDGTRRRYELLKQRVAARLNADALTAIKPDIHRLLEFQQLLLQFQAIQRVVHIPSTRNYENDTEHSYNLAMTAWFLASYFPHLDRCKAVHFALVHDLVEVHAGDTYIYADQATLDTKHEREAAALKRLESEWQDFPELTKMIHEYEQRECEEAKFVYALDKIMPIMLIYLGQGYTWQQEGIHHERLHEAKRHKVTASDEINEYYQQLHALLLENPQLFPAP